MIDDIALERPAQVLSFGHRRVPPKVCVVENKPHVRTFLADMLDELGLIARECDTAGFAATRTEFGPDLVVLGPLAREGDVPAILRMLASFDGKVMLFGGRNSPALVRAHELGERLGLAMLPPLRTPFRDSDLHENLSCFLPVIPSPSVAVDVDETLQNGWLELWYRPTIHARSLTPRGAEALIRVRHPTWGVVSPAYFVPSVNDPYFHALSQFVIMRAIGDQMRFTAENRPINISIGLPMPVLEDPQFLEYVFGKLPQGALRGGFLIEINCADAAGDFSLVRRAATQLAFHNVGITVADLGAEGAALIECRDFPVVEMKAARKFVGGCATDRLKRAVCAAIIDAARESGARSVADGVETHADYMAVRDMGFDLLQGSLFGKPMEVRKFGGALLSKRFAASDILSPARDSSC